MVYKFLFSRKAPAPIKAAFLDRDGVINIDYAYVSKKEHFDFVEGALEGIRVLVEKGYAPVLITNQSGIGRGKYTVFEFKKLCCWLEGVLAKQNTPLLAVYFCPHHPEKAFAPYQVNSENLSVAKSDVMCLHCLPAHRGEEITEEVFEEHSKEIFDEAENRLHAQKAVMVKLLK